MDAGAYNMSFDKEQLSVLCANYDRRIDSLGAETKKLKAENDKLRKVCKMMRDHIKDSCDVCDEYYCSSWDEDNECCVFDTYMLALGVEVSQ